MAGRSVKVLSDADEQWLEAMGGKQWQRKTRAHRAQRARHFALLNTLVDGLAAHGVSDPLEAQTLRDLMAIALSKDGTFGSEFRDRRAKVLNDEGGWQRLWSVCAGKIVEEYLRQRTAPPAITPTLLLDTDLQRTIGELVGLAIQQGELSEKQGREAQEDFIQPAYAPDMVEAARTRLEELLVHDINVAHQTSAGEIPTQEREMEIAKGALLKLKISQLRRIAESEELPLLADREAISTLIARKYNASRAEIADLILKYAKDDPEVGYATHLLPLHTPPDVADATKRLSGLAGNYLRLAVAHWLVFTQPPKQRQTPTSTGVEFAGEIRYYDVTPQREGEKGEITAKKRKAPIAVRLAEKVSWVEVDGRNVTEIRRLRPALHNSIGVPTTEFVAVNVPPLEGIAHQWNRRSLLMLHILETGLRDQHIDYANFTMAQFSSPSSDTADPDPLRPTIRQVRLSGQHVLSSPDVCRLISVGRQMLTVEFRARYKPDLSKAGYHASVRIVIDEDHASVLTSYGEDRAISFALHKELVRRLRRALDAGIERAQQLDNIIGQIGTRATQIDAESADILGPDMAEQVSRPPRIPHSGDASTGGGAVAAAGG